MASRSISAVRTWARNPEVGDEKGCVSCCRSPLSGERSARWPPGFSAESSSLECSPRLPEPLGFSSLLMAPHPDKPSALYSNAEVVRTITQDGHEKRHFCALQPSNYTESMRSEASKFDSASQVSLLPTTRVRTANSRHYFSPGETGNTVWRGSGMAASPLAARHKIAFSIPVSAASATEKSRAADSFAPGASFVLA